MEIAYLAVDGEHVLEQRLHLAFLVLEHRVLVVTAGHGQRRGDRQHLHEAISEGADEEREGTTGNAIGTGSTCTGHEVIREHMSVQGTVSIRCCGQQANPFDGNGRRKISH